MTGVYSKSRIVGVETSNAQIVQGKHFVRHVHGNSVDNSPTGVTDGAGVEEGDFDASGAFCDARVYDGAVVEALEKEKKSGARGGGEVGHVEGLGIIEWPNHVLGGSGVINSISGNEHQVCGEG